MIFRKPATKQTVTLVLTIFTFLFVAFPVFAQSGFTLLLYPPDLTNFPKITLYLDAYDAQGKFISTMNLNDFKVYEDGFERVVNEAHFIEPGLHTIVAFNLGATLSNRKNVLMPTRYEEAVFTLTAWLSDLQSDAANQYSLTSNEGILVNQLQDKNSFTYQLQNYKPNLYNFQPDFSSLSLALDIAEQPDLIPNSKESILYVTPLPLDQALEQLPEIRSRAIELAVPIYIWLIAPETAANAPAVEKLSELANSTGGSFYFFSENSQPPDPEEFVGRLRHLYEVIYTSGISQSGTHTVAVEGFYGNQSVKTPEIQFSISLSLPSAVLVNLPDEIVRRYTEGGNGRKLEPTFITLNAEYYFPDGYNRQLRATRLYVDGEVVAENKEAPFEFFAWPLESYQFSGEHLLSVEVEDILGFRNVSPPVSVIITVESLYPAWLTAILKFFSGGGWIPVAILALGGTIAAGRHVHRKRLAALANAGVNSVYEITVDPLQQQVPGVEPYTEDVANIGDISSTHQGMQVKETPPQLIWVGEGPPPFASGSIQIATGTLKIGSDAERAEIVLTHPSISPLHAELVRSESGSVRLADLGSETGTWVNFAPVSTKGTTLNQGDLVQIGKLCFRYKIGS